MYLGNFSEFVHKCQRVFRSDSSCYSVPALTLIISCLQNFEKLVNIQLSFEEGFRQLPHGTNAYISLVNS